MQHRLMLKNTMVHLTVFLEGRNLETSNFITEKEKGNIEFSNILSGIVLLLNKVQCNSKIKVNPFSL